MIDNFELFKSFMSFDSEDQFYFLQIYQRRKDNSFLKGDNKTIKDYFIYSVDELEKKKQDIIRVCEDNNARAYIRPNRRSSSLVALEAITWMTNSLKEGRPRDAYRAYYKACGNSHIPKDKFWIVDVDSLDPDYILSVKDYIYALYNLADGRREIAVEVPTMNGIHFICPGFNKKEFLAVFPEVSIHTDNPSLLFCNIK